MGNGGAFFDVDWKKGGSSISGKAGGRGCPDGCCFDHRASLIEVMTFHFSIS
jgi:hypothetical protein